MNSKFPVLLPVTICVFLLLASCGHTHEWSEATCTEAKTCAKCGETEGEPLGHSWVDATCTEAKTCSVCGTIEGDALGHDWVDATCTEAKTCNVCGNTEGDALGHDWVDATCTEAKTCVKCGETEGEPLGHSVSEWTISTDATCSSEGMEVGECSVCGESVQQTIDKLDHTPGEWEVTVAATSSSKGERSQKCVECGEILNTEEYELSAEEIEAQYKSSCTAYSYETIARDPDKYILTYGKYTGEIVQVIEDGDDMQLRVNITKGRYTYSDTIYVVYTKKEGESRLLEDDIITIYGVNMGTVSYTSVMGATITLPCVYAEYIDLN